MMIQRGNQMYDEDGILVGWTFRSRSRRIVFVPRREEDVEADRRRVLPNPLEKANPLNGEQDPDGDAVGRMMGGNS